MGSVKVADKKSFIIYEEWAILFKELPTEEAGELIQAVCIYHEDKSYTPENPVVAAMFEMIKKKMDKDAKSYEEVCKQRSIAGQESAKKRAKGNKTQQSATNVNKIQQMLTSVNKSEQMSTDNDNDNENDTDNDNYSLSSIKDTTCGTDVPRADIEQVISAWNDLPVSNISKISAGSNRYKLLKTRLKEYGIDKVLYAISQIRQSDFLTGQNSKGWVITFDWFIKPNNFVKVLDGNYQNRGAPSSGNQFVDLLRQMETDSG